MRWKGWWRRERRRIAMTEVCTNMLVLGDDMVQASRRVPDNSIRPLLFHTGYSIEATVTNNPAIPLSIHSNPLL